MARARPAFTLVEILIVVIILAIIAGIVVPNITSVTTISRETNLKENLSKLRVHIQVFRNQHDGFPDGATFADQMTKYTDFHGDVSPVRDAAHRYGPYIEQMPPNPVSNSKTIRVSVNPGEHFPPGDIDGGWWYNEVTGRFFADLTDAYVDREGQYYNQY